jgi:hypothetical protein
MVQAHGVTRAAPAVHRADLSLPLEYIASLLIHPNARVRRLRFSESIPDTHASLAECARQGLGDIVSKRKDAPYRSGTRSGWIKVKTSEWRADKRWRGESPGGVQPDITRLKVS